MGIFDFLDPQYVRQQLDKLSNINLSLSQLRDDLRGSGGKTLTDIVDAITGQIDTKTSVIDSRLHNASDGKSVYDHLKTLAETGVGITNFPSWFTNSTITLDTLNNTVAGLKGVDGRTLTDLYNKLSNLGGSFSITNFPSWFTGSSKLTDDLYDRLSDIYNKFNFANWIGKVGIGNGTNVVSVISGTLGGSSAYLLGVAPDLAKMYAGGTNYEESEVTASTTESSSSFSPPLKFVKIINEGDVDALIRLNGASATQIPIPAHTGKAILFPVSSIYYVTSSGSTTLRIEGFA